jgi:hypothetical protein
VLYFFVRGSEKRICEMRLHPDRNGYELIVREGEQEHVEQFGTLESILRREHELVQAWRATGWRLIEPSRR